MTGPSPLDFPCALDGRGRTAATDHDDHVRDLIEQVLFTAPGERVMRPDFGSGLLGAGLRARRAGGRGDRPVPRAGLAGARAVGAPDRGRVGRGRGDRRRARGDGRLRRTAHRRARGGDLPRSHGRCAHEPLRLRRPAPAAGGQAGRASSTASSTSRSATPTRRRRRCASARCFVRLLRPGAGDARPGQRRRSTAASGSPTVGVEWAAPATALPATLPAAEQAALRRRPRRARPRAGRPDRLPAATSRATRFAPGRRRRAATPPPAGFDPLLAEVEFSFKVECPSDFDCAPPCTCPPERPPRAADRLPRQGLREVPPAHARPDGAARARVDRAHPADVGVAARRAAGLRRRRAVLPAGRGGDRGLPRHRPAPGLAAPARPARRLPGARRLQRAGVGAGRGRAHRRWCCRPATTLLSGVPALPAVLEPVSTDHEAALAAGPVVFETVEEAVLHDGLDTTAVLDLGRAGLLPARRRDRRHAARRPPAAAGRRRPRPRRDVSPVDRASRRTPTPPSGTPSGWSTSAPPPTRPARSSRAATTDVTEIRWHADDALPFPLCVTDRRHRDRASPGATSCSPTTARPSPATTSARCPTRTWSGSGPAPVRTTRTTT